MLTSAKCTSIASHLARDTFDCAPHNILNPPSKRLVRGKRFNFTRVWARGKRQTGCQTAVGIRRQSSRKVHRMQKWRGDEWQGVKGGGLVTAQSSAVCRQSCTSVRNRSATVRSYLCGMMCWHRILWSDYYFVCDLSLFTLAKDCRLWGNMLTSSNQYLRPDYLTPLPTTVRIYFNNLIHQSITIYFFNQYLQQLNK